MTARLRVELRAAAAALTFLTRVPLGRLYLGGEDVRRAGVAFAPLGAGIGAVAGGLTVALAGALTPLLAAAVAIAGVTALTGALHLDGLADTADALGAPTRERALSIMRDHAVGAYGTSAIGLDLLLKTAALAALAHDSRALPAAIAAGALSRATPVLLAAALPYARAGQGAAAPLVAGGWRRAALAGVVAVALALLAARRDGLLMSGCALAVAISLGFALRRWLGGVTGDTLGSSVELTETAVLVVAVAAGGAR